MFATLAPGGRLPRRRRRPRGAHGRRRRATCTAARNGAGHFVKMVHNGIEYGLMAAYAEGLNILKHANAWTQERDGGCRDRAARRAALFQYTLDVAAITEVWRHGSIITSRLLDLTAEALAQDAALERLRRPGVRFGRGPLDRARRRSRRACRRTC